jgi:hypothetical protein
MRITSSGANLECDTIYGTFSHGLRIGNIFNKVNTLLKRTSQISIYFLAYIEDQYLYMHTQQYNTGTMSRSIAKLATHPTTKISSTYSILPLSLLRNT